MKKIVSITFLFLITLSVLAQETAEKKENQFTLSGQIRPRVEVRSGAYRPIQKGEDAAVLVSDRIRLQADYKFKDLLTTRISLQTVGIWGQEAMVQNTASNGNSFAIFEAWADVKLAENVGLKFGRQVISLDDERYFGALDWAQGARAHDAASLYFSNSKFTLQSYYAYNQNYEELYNGNIANPTGNYYSTSGAFPYKTMQTLWAEYKFPALRLTALFSNQGLQNASSSTTGTSVKNLQTVGANAYFKLWKINTQLTSYFQMGKNLAGQDVDAYMYALSANLPITEKWSIGANYDYLSGGSNAENYKAFVPHFGTNHKFYGYMDYYYVGNAHGNNGLADFGISTGYKFNKRFTGKATFHQFNSAEDIQNYDKNLGQEIDLDFGYKVNNFVSIVGGYSAYFTTSTIETLKDISNPKSSQDWVWVTVNVNPKMFDAKF